MARIEAIRLFLAYASYMGFMVYQMDVKSAFLYGQIEEEVSIMVTPVFEDPDHPDKVSPKISHLLVVKRIFGYLKGKPSLGLWYSKDSLLELVAYTNSDYDGAT
ncbi:putative ribonuclease H-like domain-containing protein [Tanacetum coccineum]